MAETLASDINLISSFLANDQVGSSGIQPVDCIVICASSVLYQADTLFKTLEENPTLTKTLVLVGGIGHSTQLLYDAVAKSPKYHNLSDVVSGLPEARVLELVLKRHFDVAKIERPGCKILVEDKSTNCGSNAIETKKLLENSGVPPPRSCLIIQDPTMSLRTLASFRKAYEAEAEQPEFTCWPVFVPKMAVSDRGELEWDVDGMEASELWDKERFFELIVGEVPRLRDDEDGYGPNGKGFIAHVDVPVEVDEAWERVRDALKVDKR